MASEDNMLRLDVRNYDDEILFRLDKGDINIYDIVDFYDNKYISSEQFIDYVSYWINNLMD